MPRHSARRRSASRRQLSSDQTVQLLENRCLLTSLTPDLFQANSIGDYGPFVVSEPQNATIPYANHQARFDQTQRYQTFGRNQVKISDEYFDVVPGQKIGLRGWAKSGDEFNLRFAADDQQSFGVIAYDADYLQISPEHVLKHENSADTNLTAALRPGDTSFTVADATEWSTTADPATRSLAWYGYSNSHGQTYADYTYTRNVASDATIGLWSVSGIDNVSGVITLNKPWAGPLLPSGTAVRNATGGPDHSSIALNKEAVEGDFTYRQFDALIDGIDDGSGIHRKSHLPAGSRFLKVIIQSNQHGELNNQITWREIELLNLKADAAISDLVQPNVESFSSAEFPVMESDAGYYPAPRQARSNAFVTVDTNQEYRISADMLDISTDEEHPVSIESFDSDRLLIHSLHVTRFKNAVDTRLSSDLRPGQTQIQLNDATGWSNSPGATAESRSLAWYGYQNSEGQTYRDYTYTRNVAAHLIDGMWDPGAIQLDAGSGQWSIQLSKPWAGPVVLAGTAVRNATGHDHQQFFNIVADFNFDYSGDVAGLDRLQYEADFGNGTWQGGIPNALKFRPGTAFVKPMVIDYLRFSDDWLRLGPVSTFAIDAQQTATFADQPAIWLNRSRQEFQSDKNFFVDTSRRHLLTADIAAGTTIDGSEATTETHSLGYFAFDSDHLPIRAEHVQKYATSTDTELAAALRPGDTVIHLVDATGWSNTDTAETRAIAWYGYQNSTGHVYPDFSYTRSVAAGAAFGLWDIEAIRNNQITLRTPWAGPTLSAGEAVRNALSGDSLMSAILNEGSVANQWNSIPGWVKGEWQHGIRSENQFPPGTASIRLGGRANEPNLVADDQLHIRRMTISATSDQINEVSNTNQVVIDLDVLANDEDLESLSISNVGQPTFGTAEIISTAGPGSRDILRYTANEFFVGTDRFTYTATNSVNGQSATTTVSVTVNGSNLQTDVGRAAGIGSQATNPVDDNSPPEPTRNGPHRQQHFHTAESGLWSRADDRPTESLLTFS